MYHGLADDANTEFVSVVGLVWYFLDRRRALQLQALSLSPEPTHLQAAQQSML